MVWNYINYTQQAFEVGDLNDEGQLKLALQYENKLGMRSVYQPICDKLEAHPDCNLIDMDADAPVFPGSLAFIEQCRKSLNQTTLPSVVNHLEPYLKFEDKYGMVKAHIETLLKFGQANKNRAQRLNVIKPTWSQYLDKHKKDWLWVSEKDSNLETKAQIQKLGLYHYRSQNKGTWFLQFHFKVQQCYKPSWLDAGLAFYFDSASAFSQHGVTRDLATGKTGLKEWLTPVEQAELWDVSVLSLAEDFNFEVMTDSFKNAHRQRILENRT